MFVICAILVGDLLGVVFDLSLSEFDVSFISERDKISTFPITQHFVSVNFF